MLSENILHSLIQPFGLEMGSLEFLRCSQNYVYRALLPTGEKCILRVTTGRHRQLAEVETELKWISYLVHHGVTACAPVLTTSGEPCVVLEVDGIFYTAACFEHAPGEPVNPRQPELDSYLHHYQQLGLLLGNMHVASPSVSCGFDPASWPRLHWHESRLLRQDLLAIRDRLSDVFCERVNELIDDLRHYDQSPSTYGLIHADVSFNNCFFHEGRPWIFDFDNCEYGYFIQDIATVLYDSIYCKVLNKFADDGLTERMVPLFKAFLLGYSQTGVLQSINLAQLKKLFLLREAVIYIHYHRTLDVEHASDSFKSGLDVMRINVETGQHQVDFDYLLTGQDKIPAA